MTETHIDDQVMAACLARAVEARTRGDLPIAAAIACDGVVLAFGVNSSQSSGDPTAHAELEAVRTSVERAVARGASANEALGGATLYATLEPCPMCCSAALRAGVERLVLGARNSSLGRTQHGNYNPEALAIMLDRPLTVVTGVRETDCEALLTPPFLAPP